MNQRGVGAPLAPRLDAPVRIVDDGAMNRALLVFAATLALATPAYADFASCVASLRSDAAAKGVSAKTIAAAFDKVQPDAKA